MIKPTNVVHDLGVWIDANLTMRSHVSRVAQTCFFHLRCLRCLRRQLGQDVTARLITSPVLPRLDYCNPVLVGLPATTLASLQRVLHTAARIVFNLRPRDHVTPAMSELHWLPVAERFDYKLCLLVHKALVGHAPHFQSTLQTWLHRLPIFQRDRRCGPLTAATSSSHEQTARSAVASPHAWNQLPTDLKLQQSTTTFRRHLKTFLFQWASSLETPFWLCNALRVYLVWSALEITAVTITVNVT